LHHEDHRPGIGGANMRASLPPFFDDRRIAIRQAEPLNTRRL